MSQVYKAPGVRMIWSLNPVLNQKIDIGIKKSLIKAGFIWEKEAKEITRNEGHIKTGRYVKSIGKVKLEGIKEFIKDDQLRIGSKVFYSVHLEARYAIFLRAIDSAKEKFLNVFKDIL